MKQKKKYILIAILIGIIAITGISYAVWQITKTQEKENVVTAGCFRITFTGQNDIELQEAFPISNEEGKVLTPYTFTITNECASFASYQVNLEILNSTTFTDLTYMKVMLNDKVDNLTQEKETTKTLENATKSYKLKNGYLREFEEKTFTLRLWMDEDTSTSDAYMNQLLESKITVINTYVTDLNNKIETSALSQNEKYSDTETFSLHVTSERFPIVSISEDLETWEELEEKGTDVTVEKTVTVNKAYTYYFQDEAENVKEVTFVATKIDDKKPIANMSVTKENNVVSIDASGSKDNETSISKYYYSKDGTNFMESNESTYSFTDAYEYGIAPTMLMNFEESETKKVYIKVEDEVGNVSDVKEVSIPTDFAYDETADNNLRFIGANPNNYVSFNNELWRIIGVMNNIDDGTGKKETRLKIIRKKSIGNYLFDNKSQTDETALGSAGSSDWSTSNLKKVLNEEAYFNRTSGTCPSGKAEVFTSCDFSSMGLLDESKSFISDVKWNLGGIRDYLGVNQGMTNTFYELERGSLRYNETRALEWIGKIGLIYPSDYGYATSGSKDITRETCLATKLYYLGSHPDCSVNNWLYNETYKIRTITPYTYYSFQTFIIKNGSLRNADVEETGVEIFPTLYLNSNIKITSGEGTETHPFLLSTDS